MTSVERIDRKVCERLVEAYGAAWQTKDPDAILRIFTEDARYIERPQGSGPVDHSAIYVGHDGIRAYWNNHIVQRERNIHFIPCHEDLMWDHEKHKCLAKWEASFEVLQLDSMLYKPVHFVQVAILELDPATHRIRRLEEYWHSLLPPKGKAAKGVAILELDPATHRIRRLEEYWHSLLPPKGKAAKGDKAAPPGAPQSKKIRDNVKTLAPLFHACVNAALRPLPKFKNGNKSTGRYAVLQKATRSHGSDDNSAWKQIKRSGKWNEWYAEVLAHGDVAAPHARLGMSKKSQGPECRVKHLDVLLPSGTDVWSRFCSRIIQRFPMYKEVLVPRLSWSDTKDPVLESAVSPEIRLLELLRSAVESFKDLPMGYVTRHGVHCVELHNHLPLFSGRELPVVEGHCGYATQQEAHDNVAPVMDALIGEMHESLRISVRPRHMEDESLFYCLVTTLPVAARTTNKADAENPQMAKAACAEVASKRREHDGIAANGSVAATSAPLNYPAGDNVPGAGCLELPIGAIRVSQVAAVAYEGPEQGRFAAWVLSWAVTTGVIGSTVLTHGDDKGMVWPALIAPVQVSIHPLLRRDESHKGEILPGPGAAKLQMAKELNTRLQKLGIRSVVDFRLDVGPKAQFRKCEAEGIPIVVTIGTKQMTEAKVRLLRRTGNANATEDINVDNTSRIVELLQEQHEQLPFPSMDDEHF